MKRHPGKEDGPRPIGADVEDDPARQEGTPPAYGESGERRDFDTTTPLKRKPFVMDFADRFEREILLLDPKTFRSIQKLVNKGALGSHVKRLRDEQHMSEQDINLLLDSFIKRLRLRMLTFNDDLPPWRLFVRNLDSLQHDVEDRRRTTSVVEGKIDIKVKKNRGY